MRLLKFSARRRDPETLRTERLLLRRPEMTDYEDWSKLRGESAAFLKPYEPKWASDELSRAAYRLRMRRQDAEINSGRALPWFLFSVERSPQLMGGLTLSNIRRGIADTATLGYWMGERFAGQGYMREAVAAICTVAFTGHGLHRIEAATLTDNERSKRLLRRCGFREEGEARAYLRIDGVWRDHTLFARLDSDAVAR